MLASPQVPKKMTKKESGGQNIKVFVRVRPMNSSEKNGKSISSVECQGTREVVVRERPLDKFSKKFSFDKVFGEKSHQIELYRSVAKPLVDEVLSGFNCTIFAYGQTGTGKTYTMEGEQCDLETSWEENPHAGIIPRCVNQLFDELRIQQLEFTMRVSFLELYNEEVFDLLSAHDDLSKLKLYEDSARKGSCIIQGLEEVLVRSKSDVYDIVAKGSAKRQTAATEMNAHSSRSHTVFTVTVHIRENNPDGSEFVKTGKLHLVDLAGSENIGRSGAVNKRAREAGNINQSLLTLGRVITSLVDRAPHIPYRESKLTRLLQDALGGRTKTSIIATVSPASINLEETLSTLDYAHRAKNIQNKPEVNQKLNKKELITEYTFEIDRLRKDLLAVREKNGVYLANDNYQEMVSTMERQAKEILENIAHSRALEEDLEKQKAIFDELDAQLVQKTSELEKTESNLATTKEALVSTQKLLTVTTNEREEQKFLVDSHKKTEEKLLREGKSLIGVADTTTSDIEKLHQKLDRKRIVEDKNKEIEKSFTEKFEDDIKLIQENIVANSSNLEKASSTLAHSLLEGSSEFQKKFSDLTSILQSLTQWSTENLNSANADLQQNHEAEVQIVDAMTDKVTSKSSQVENQLKNFEKQQLTVNFEKILGVLSQIHSSVVEIQENVCTKLTLMEKSSNDTMIEMNAITEKLAELQTNFMEKEQKMDLEDHKNNEQAHKERIQRTKEMRSLVASFLGLLDQSEESELAHNTSQHERQSNRQHTVNDYSKKLNNCQKELSSEISKSNEEFTAIKNATEKALQEITGKQKEDLATLEDKFDSLQNCVKSTLSKAAESSASLVSIASESKVSYKAASGKTVELMTSRIKALDDGITDKTNLVKETYKEQCQKTVSCMESNAKCIVESSCTNQKETETQQELLANTCTKVVKLFDSELQRDQPTGETPVRREYKYSRILPATSPHDKLLAKFKGTIGSESQIPLPQTNLSFEEELVEAGSLQSLPSSADSSHSAISYSLQRSESFKDSTSFAIPHPQIQRQTSKGEMAPLTKCPSESSLREAKENNVTTRSLKIPTIITNYGRTANEKHKQRKILGPHN